MLRLLAEETFTPFCSMRNELVKAGGLPQLYAQKKTNERSQLNAPTLGGQQHAPLVHLPPPRLS